MGQLTTTFLLPFYDSLKTLEKIHPPYICEPHPAFLRDL